MKIYIVIAAFNEEKKISSVIKNLQEEGYNHIIVVDDGSKDKTYDQANSTGAIVLKHVINRGQGAALKTGIDYSVDQGAEILVTFDADGQHDAKQIKKLINPLIEEKAEVVLGSRFLDDSSNTPPLRKFFLKTGAFIFRIMYGVKLTDSHNGFRALSRKAAQEINLSQDKMEHASEIVEEIGKHKLKYLEVPVTITYTDYSLQHGQRTSNAFKIFFKMILKAFLK
ncbi:glycosyltransferase family 2 protein [archaeon]|jgi:polyprenyl-phospho-N-acetylgalactosaminyl synthase|nr:glycosyltransferase family 2 protein [archaeon]MBT3451155.1 glycosyltransferase family 2 protein [archaeon]MBT6869306.1 glycosyltransferase family 2 protein [archaeon]MBT7192469.1 glycosyltransferase family 2 protein [archaeon]MBT7380545.1 glycosyltransferase family 2 protein [archaeon]